MVSLPWGAKTLVLVRFSRRADRTLFVRPSGGRSRTEQGGLFPLGIIHELRVECSNY